MKKVISAVLVGLFAMASQAFAAIDVTAVTTGVSDATTAITTVIGALLALSIAIFGISKVYSFVKRRAGA